MLGVLGSVVSRCVQLMLLREGGIMHCLVRGSAVTCVPTGCWEKKEVSAQSRGVKESEVEFLFVTRKPIFLAMCRLRFLSVPLVDCYVWIYFITCLFCFFIFYFFYYFLFLIPTYQSFQLHTWCRLHGTPDIQFLHLPISTDRLTFLTSCTTVTFFFDGNSTT